MSLALFVHSFSHQSLHAGRRKRGHVGRPSRAEGRARSESSATESAQAGVGERPKDGAGVLVHDLPKVHDDGEQKDQKEKVDAQDRVQKPAQSFWREHVQVHPHKGDDGEDGEYANDNAGGAFGPVGCEGLLDEGQFRVRAFRLRV